MDASRFDRLTRLFAAAATRRSTVVSLLTAPLALAIGGTDAAPRSRKRRKSKKKRSRRGNSSSNATAGGRGNTGGGGNSGETPTTASVPACSRSWRTCSVALAQAGAVLQGCDFTRQRLASLNLSGALLEGASLLGANLEGAVLEGSVLTNACLASAILRNASLRGANLAGADLSGANLAGADLRGTNITNTQLASAFLCNTHLPDGTVSDRDLGSDHVCVDCNKGCPAGESCCNRECVDLEKDVNHCFACENRCPKAPPNASVFCDELPDVTGSLVAGCYYACDDGWLDCDDIFENGCEVRVDANNCAECGHVCDSGLECCDCKCVPPGTTDCGFCPEIRNAKLIRRP